MNKLGRYIANGVVGLSALSSLGCGKDSNTADVAGEVFEESLLFFLYDTRTKEYNNREYFQSEDIGVDCDELAKSALTNHYQMRKTLDKADNETEKQYKMKSYGGNDGK